MRVLIAPNKFEGSLTAAEPALTAPQCMAQGAAMLRRHAAALAARTADASAIHTL